jgi:hypothetical protein
MKPDSAQCHQNQLYQSSLNQKTEWAGATEAIVDKATPDTIGDIAALMH